MCMQGCAVALNGLESGWQALLEKAPRRRVQHLWLGGGHHVFLSTWC